MLFTLVLAFLLFHVGLAQTGLSAKTWPMDNTHHYAVLTQGSSCASAGCAPLTTKADCTNAANTLAGSTQSNVAGQQYMSGGAVVQTMSGLANTYNWGGSYPQYCFQMRFGLPTDPSMYGLLNQYGGTQQPCTAQLQCICRCANPTMAPTPAPTTAAPTRNPTTRMPTSTPTAAPTPAPTLTVCQKLKGEQKEKCGGESPVSKVIQKVQDAVDTSPQDPMVDLGEYKLSDLEKEQKEGTCGFAKSDPAYLATELVLKINKLSTLV